VNSLGKIMWATPQAEAVVDTLSPGSDVVLLVLIPQWLVRPVRARPARRPPHGRITGNEQLRLQYMGRLGANEFLLRRPEGFRLRDMAEFSSELGLQRAGEVLVAAQGKTNRDIAQIWA
jgi:hypothetical protein